MATMSARILVTGSRLWTDAAAIQDALATWIPAFGGVVTVVHGGARGADEIAARLAWTAFGPDVRPESWAADWHRWGRSAGVRRNAEMVAAGADVCLAFPLGESRGTRDCMRRAKAAGIKVVDLGDGSEP